MSRLKIKTQEKIKEIVIRYLKGENLDVLKVRLTLLATEHEKSCEELFKQVKLDPNDAYLKDIFENINLPKTKQKDALQRYHNLFELMAHFEYIGKHQFEHLIKTVKSTHPPKNWWLTAFIGAIVAGGVSLLFHFKPQVFDNIANWFQKQFPVVVNWAQKTFSALKNFALVGLIYNSLGLMFKWYQAIQKRRDANSFRIGSLIFDTLGSAFTISAYATTYFLGGAMAVASASLFILSSATNVIRSLYFLWSSHQALGHLTRPEKSASIEEKLEYTRASNLHQRSLQILFLKLGVATAITASVIITSLVPISLPVTVGCFAFITLLNLAETALKGVIKKHYAKSLQQATAEICDADLEHKLSLTQAASRINQEWKKLHKAQRQLEQEKFEFEKAKHPEDIEPLTELDTVEEHTHRDQVETSPAAQYMSKATGTSDLSRSDCRALAQYGVFAAANDTVTGSPTNQTDLPLTFEYTSPK